MEDGSAAALGLGKALVLGAAGFNVTALSLGSLPGAIFILVWGIFISALLGQEYSFSATILHPSNLFIEMDITEY
jgi:hypothetical protein